MSRIDEALRQAGLRSPAAGIAESVPSPVEAFPAATEFPAAAESVVVERTPPERLPVEPPRPAVRPPQQARPFSEVRFAPDEKLVVHAKMSRTSVEQYRRIAATLHHMQQERGLKVLMVASAAVGEGKTLTAANLALTLSESYRRRVLLIDADLRRPSLTAVFHLQRARGLAEQLRGELEGPLRVLELSDCLALLPGGQPDSDPMASLTSGRMHEIIEQASASYDWVILDTPPISLQPDASLLAAMVEAVVFVIGAGMAPAAAVDQSVEALGRDKVVGVVLNRAADTAVDDSYYNYYPAFRPADDGDTQLTARAGDRNVEL